MHSSIPQQLVSTTCCFKSRRLLAIGIALGVSSVTSAVAGNLHARATLDGIPSISFASHSGTAHAERVTGSRFCKVTERATYNDMNCNAGSGHAHHHRSISFSSLALDDDGAGFIDLLPSAAPPPPRPGLSGITTEPSSNLIRPPTTTSSISVCQG